MPWTAVVGAVAGAVINNAMAPDAPEQQASKSATDQAAAAAQAQKLAQDRWDYYKARADRVLPQVQRTEDQVFADANAGVRNRAPEERALAAADVEQSYGREVEATKRRMQASGIDTSSPRAMALLSQLSLGKAKTQALAMNNAGRDATNRAEDLNYTRRVQALSLDKGLPVPGMEGASAAFGAASGSALRIADAQRNASTMAGYAGQRGATALANAWGSNSGGGYNRDQPSPYDTGPFYTNTGNQSGDPVVSRNTYIDSNGVNNDPWAYRDGGPVRRAMTFENGGDIDVGGGQVVDPNAGGGRDTIPAVIDGKKRAALDSGEFIVPTDVVRMKGVEFFQKLIEKYHRHVPNSKGKANGGAIQIGLPRSIEDAIYSTMAKR